jgi:hypothetical protein
MCLAWRFLIEIVRNSRDNFCSQKRLLTLKKFKKAVKPKDRKVAREIYEPDRIAIEAKEAFLAHVVPLQTKNAYPTRRAQPTHRTVPNDEQALLTNSAKFNELASSTINKFHQDIRHEQTKQRTGINHLNRSIKEFSFFDWSKVKLSSESDSHYNKSFFDNNTNINTDPTGLNIMQRNGVVSSDLPQVITIRFT